MEFERRSTRTEEGIDSAITMSRRKSRMLIGSQLPGTDTFTSKSPTTKNETMTQMSTAQDEFEKTVVNRLFKDANMRAQRKEMMNKESEKIEKIEVQEKPVINALSKQMTEKTHEPPIHKRFAKLLARKEAKLKEL